MCWACEQDRFWAAYAEYMAAKQAADQKAGVPGSPIEDAEPTQLSPTVTPASPERTRND
jgi:hypothetical protein